VDTKQNWQEKEGSPLHTPGKKRTRKHMNGCSTLSVNKHNKYHKNDNI